MAIRYAVANGNWSSTATWDGGTLPAAGDDVRSNGFTVTVDGNYTCLTASNRAETSPVVALGGSFSLADGAVLTATTAIIGGISALGSVEFSLASPSSATVVTPYAFGDTGVAIRQTGTGTLYIIAATVQNGSSASKNGFLQSAGISFLTGSVSGAGQVAFAHSGSAVCYMTGNVINTASTGLPSITASGVSMQITGNIEGSTGGAQAVGINVGGSCTLTVIGSTIARLTPAIISTLISPMVYLSGPLISSITGVQAVALWRWAWIPSPSGTYMEVRTSDFLASRNLYTADYTSALHMPAVADVRTGIVYGPANELTGTCAVPPAGSVALGVPVDATTGTAALTQQAIAAAVGPLIAAYGT